MTIFPTHKLGPATLQQAIDSIARHKLFNFFQSPFQAPGVKSLAICFTLLFLFYCSEKLPVYPIHTQFTLKDHNGQSFQMQSLQGQIVLLYFGFTRCPVICPNTLTRLQKAYQILGLRRHRLKILMATVDPEYDTIAVLKDYLSNYKADILGLWGNKSQIANVTAKFGIVFSKNEKNSVHHSSYVFLLDQKLQVRYLFDQEDTPQEIAATIRKL